VFQREAPHDLRASPALGEGITLKLLSEEEVTSTMDLWDAGFVSNLGIAAEARDWEAEDKDALWIYERHYHREMMCFSSAISDQGEISRLKDAEAFVAAWLTSCPWGVGPSWHPYPLARRIISWSVSIAKAPELAPSLVPLLAPQVRRLAQDLEFHLLGNHLLCDLCALVAGSSLIDGPGMDSIWSSSASMLESELDRQVLSDGGYCERTIQYHHIVLCDAMWALALTENRGRVLRVRGVIDKMLTFLRSMRRSDGSFPWLNDASPMFAPDVPVLEENARRLGFVLGEETVKVRGCGDVARTVFGETGWLVHSKGDNELLFDCGPVGPRDQPGHGHADTLSYELFWRGRPVVSDTGVSTYARGVIRQYERSVSAHSCVQVDGHGIDEPWASFRFGGIGVVTDVDYSVASGDCFVASAKATSFVGWVHRRTIRFRPGVELVVEDDVDLRVSGKTGPVLTFIPIHPLWTVSRNEEGYLLRGELGELQFSVLEGAIVGVESGWSAEGFGTRIPRQVIVVALERGRTGSYCIASSSS